MSLKFRKLNVVDATKHAKSFEKGIRAYVDITLNDAIEINGFRVLEHGKGLWVSAPTQKAEYDGKTLYFPYFKFSNAKHNESLAEDIIKAYKDAVAGNVVTETKELEKAY